MLQESLTLWQGVFNIVLWGIIVWILSPALKYPYILSKAAKFWGIVFIVLFCLFPFWGGDYFHYKEYFYEIQRGGYSKMEEVYTWIIENFGYSYTFFRLIVWGGALFALFTAYKRVGNSFDLMLFYFGALFLPIFSYARVSVSIAFVMLGMSFVYKPIKHFRLGSILLGFAIVACSIFFHRSAVIGIAGFLATLLLIYNSKWKTILVVLLIPVFAYLASNLLNSFFDIDFSSADEQLNRRRDDYLSGTARYKGIGERISSLLTYLPMYLSAVAYIIQVSKKHYNTFSISERGFASFVFALMLLALVFSIDLGYNTSVLYYRSIYFAMPANAVFLSVMTRNGYNKGLMKTILWIGLLSVAYNLLYATYQAFLG